MIYEIDEEERYRKPIPTDYDGYQFRSRREAHWAYWFNLIGAEYDYELEAFRVSPVLKYLPDFFFENVPIIDNNGERNTIPELWIEVKGKFTDYDKEKVRLFAEHQHDIVVVTKIPRGTAFEQDIIDEFNREFPVYSTIYADGTNTPVIPAYLGGELILVKAGNTSCYRLCNSGITGEAYLLARKARFDHDQTPGTDPLPSVVYDRKLIT